MISGVGTGPIYRTPPAGPTPAPPLPFPMSPLLDAFNRANEYPLTGSWLASPWWVNSLEVNGNQLRCRPADPNHYAGNYFTRSFPGRAEVYGTVATAPIAQSDFLQLEIIDTASPGFDRPNGYSWMIRGGGTAGVYRYDGGFVKPLSGVMGVTIANGDGLGLAYDPSTDTLSGWKRAGASGPWLQVFAITDPTYNGPWYVQLGLGPTVVMDDVGGADIPWTLIKRAQLNSGATPWDFDSMDLSSAGSTATRSTATPPGPIEGASFLTLTCNGADGQNGRARGMISPASWSFPARQFLKVSFWVFLPSGWKSSIPVGGSAQIWKYDCFPTTNNQVVLLYYQTDDNHKLMVKDNGVDTDITLPFVISENAWHFLEFQMKLATGPNGYATVRQDGTLVASANNVKTTYTPDNGSGHKLPWIRYGLSAHGVGQALPTINHIDDCSASYAT